MSFQNSKTFNKENKKDNDGETVIQEIPLFESEENIVANKIQLKFGEYLVAEQSKQAKDYNEKDVKEYMKWNSIVIEINLNIGNSSHTVYTCDFTHDYIDINADYRN